MINPIANWRTSSIGMTMIAGSVIHLVFAVRAGNATEGVWTASVGTIIGGVGLILAGDASQSKAQVDNLATKTKTAITTGNTDILDKPDATAQEPKKP